MPGPPPKDPAARVRRNREHRIALDADAPIDAPLLPGAWPRAVLEWYGAWCSSPQAHLFISTDWQRLHMLAPLIAEYLANPTPHLMAEIRRTESLLGAT